MRTVQAAKWFSGVLLGLVMGYQFATWTSAPSNGANTRASAVRLEAAAPATTQIDLAECATTEDRGAPRPVGAATKETCTCESTLASTPPLDALLDAIDDDELATITATLTDFPVDLLLQRKDLRGYVKRLAQITFSDIGSPTTPWIESSSRTRAGYVQPIEFSTAVDYENLPLESKTVFASSAPKIHATFPTTDSAHQGVFVKWYRVDRAEILLAQPFAINPREPVNDIWLTQEDGWPRGNYRVEIYDAELRDLLAAGEYRVDAVVPSENTAPRASD